MEQINAFWKRVVIGKIKEGENYAIECRLIDSFYAEYLKKMLSI